MVWCRLCRLRRLIRISLVLVLLRVVWCIIGICGYRLRLVMVRYAVWLLVLGIGLVELFSLVSVRCRIVWIILVGYSVTLVLIC